MGAARDLLSFFNKVVLLAGVVGVVLGAYVHQNGEEAAHKVHIFAGAAVLLAFAGAASIALAVTGLCATTNESRSFHAVYFLFTLAVYSLVVIVTVATAINEPRIESILGTECEEHPWPNCSQDLPEIVTAVKANLKTVFYGALTVTGSLAALMTMTVFSAGEAKRAEYYEIKTVHPQFIVG